ncbi:MULTISPECIES: response regulator transcription factor [Agromyces]|uniref:Response regulator n=1 Tax=Agromyces kandeliae TaxID=2666141 RepID=A0A6L5R3H1_9MICO|nr:response regulator transcription factor [Agromyces kandeliae]MRX44616.1 response regulator [Agromyces kandeliae]
MPEPLRIAIAEDHYLVREGVRHAVENGGLTVIAAVSTAVELAQVVERERPDAVVTDIRMPPHHRTEGVDAALAIRAAHPEIGVVVLSQHNDPAYAMSLFREGTRGLAYLLKERVGRPAQLLAAIREVVDGGSVVDADVVATMVAHSRRNADSPLLALTDREHEVLALVAGGASNRAIAERLHLSQSSIEKYLGSIFTKLGLADEPDVHRRVAAVLAFFDDQRRARPI